MHEQREQKIDLLENNSNAVRAVMSAVEGAESQVLNGVLISRERLMRQMPLALQGEIKLLVLDDTLEQEKLDQGTMATESGFQQYLVLKEEFRVNLQKLIETGVQAVFVDRGVETTGLRSF